jgi:hypothetical protein
MHTASIFTPEDFEVEIDGRSVGLSGLFPDGTALDRFGIVVTDVLGGTAASLLINAAIARFYEIRPGRRGERPAYPEIYLFHVGGPHGDHGAFDFWPPRKELLIRDDDPVSLLTAINAQGITRLAVPDIVPGDPDRLTSGLSTWAEQAAARDRISSCFVYSASGQVVDADVRIKATGANVESNAELAISPDTFLGDTEANIDHPDYLPGPSVPVDNRRYIDHTWSRVPEVSPALRERFAEARKAVWEDAGRERVEAFRRVDVDFALAILAAVRAGTDASPRMTPASTRVNGGH